METNKKLEAFSGIQAFDMTGMSRSMSHDETAPYFREILILLRNWGHHMFIINKLKPKS